jgi:GNAT superfamily N-acetyltransferase
MDFNVQLADQSMAESITDVLLEGRDEGFVFPPNRDTILEYVKDIMNKNGGLIGVIYDGENKEVEAVIGLRLDKFWFSDQWFLCDVFTFVHPEHRRSTRAKCLLAFAKNCAKKMNIPLLMGIMSNIRTEAKARLYERQFDRAGSYFVYNNESVGAV